MRLMSLRRMRSTPPKDDKSSSRCLTLDGARPERPSSVSDVSCGAPESHEAIRMPSSPRPPEIMMFL